jgi:hypothetical protein
MNPIGPATPRRMAIIKIVSGKLFIVFTSVKYKIFYMRAASSPYMAVQMISGCIQKQVPLLR